MRASYFKPFVLSLSKHEWLDFAKFFNPPHFDKLSANGLKINELKGVCID
jgi:hypothetical protein